MCQDPDTISIFIGHRPEDLLKMEVYKDKIKAIFEANHGRYGTIRIQKSLEAEGIRVNRKE